MSARSHVHALLVAAGCLAAGCRERAPELRQYREVAVEPPTRQERVADVAAMARQMPPAGGDMASTPVATGSVALKWTVPEGWVEQPGQAMRMATFLVGPDRRECTIVSFPGDVGGIEANLRRWIGQLEATVADEALAKFARAPETFQSEGGLGCLVYDFSSLLPAGSAQSMLAAIVPMDGQTVFVKLMGPATCWRPSASVSWACAGPSSHERVGSSTARARYWPAGSSRRG
jgi:hypothetical protein